LNNTVTLEVLAHNTIVSSNIIAYIYVSYTIGDHYEPLVAYIISKGYYSLILRVLWLKKDNINIKLGKIDIQFSLVNYLPYHTTITPKPIKGITMECSNKICAISGT
jgi:hypothetical protein